MFFVACSSSEGPQITPMETQIAAVGRELVVEISATNSGDSIAFDYDTNAEIDSERGSLRSRGSNSALFTWTPSARDIGVWTFDFHARDSSGSSTETITIEVRSAIGQDSLPIFRRPLGAGTSIDLATEECVGIEILIEDQDSASVKLSEEEPRITGALLVQESGLNGFWEWCPTKAQRNAQDRYMLVIGADDGNNPIALKNYQIIIRDTSVADCPGDAPVIVHTPAPQETGNGVVVTVQASDDLGIKGAVNLYYTDHPISDTPDLSAMIMVPMELTAGTVSDGNWTATLPNPVAGASAGTQAQIFYAVVADDNDDSAGNCDHTTINVFDLVVTNPGGPGGLGLCEPCTHDAQCGDTKDLCLSVGNESESFCFRECESDADCDAGYSCGPEMNSVSGAKGRQCIPDAGTCDEFQCDDDAFEDNDGITQPFSLTPGLHEELRMCPIELHSADEDWFEITVDQDSQVTLQISGLDDPNLDMRLLDEGGNLIAISEDFASNDSITRCLSPGTYFLRVYTYLFYKTYSGGMLDDMGNTYSLQYSLTSSECTTSTCTDDAFEDDDDINQARIPDFGGLGTEFLSTGNQICEADQDWYLISAFNNFNHLSVSLDFVQTDLAEDLDILIYNSVGDLLTQCTALDPSDCSDNGQSSDSGEYLTFQPPDTCSLPVDCEGCAPCDFFVVVNGFDGASNDYDICIAYSAENGCL